MGRTQLTFGTSVALMGMLVAGCNAMPDDVVSGDLDVVVGTIASVVLRDVLSMVAGDLRLALGMVAC